MFLGFIHKLRIAWGTKCYDPIKQIFQEIFTNETRMHTKPFVSKFPRLSFKIPLKIFCKDLKAKKIKI